MRRRGWWLAGAVVVLGLVAFYVAYRPANAAEARRAWTTYLRDAKGPGLAAIAGGVAIVTGLGAAATRRRRTPEILRLDKEDPSSAIAAIPVDKVREIVGELRTLLRRTLASADMVSFVDLLLKGAIRCRASDIHVHPLEKETRVSFRVQGLLEDVLAFEPEHHRQLVQRLKVMARLNIFRADTPQDGHFAVDTAEGQADIRLSVLPTNHGEKVVLRIANVGHRVPTFDELGMPAGVAQRFRLVLGRPQGVVFLTGPTGAGKTTTIYASLAHIKGTRGETTQIATIEDPIEFDVPFLTQTQVNTETGLTFAKGLRSILRQDPNVIMVGEIRDAETAHIAVQAGLTGHQIVTTVHADSAAGAFNRLIEMGVEPFLLASASLASLAQRLVRALCPHCRVPAEPAAEELQRLQLHGLPETGYFVAHGCPKCDQSGYLGRTAFYELVEVTPAIRELINAKVPTGRIQEAAVAAGMPTLLDAGIERARAGATSLREVFRVCG